MPPIETGEEIIYTARRHWFILVGEIALLVLFAVLPGLLLFVPHLLPAELVAAIKQATHVEGNFSLSVLFLWTLELLLLWIIFMMFWTDYYLDVWLITNHRVIDIEQKGLFSRRVSAFRFNQIQDVTAEVPGVLATFVDFGTVKIRTASEETFDFRGVACPNLVKEKIMSEHHRVHTSTVPSNK